MGIVLFSGEELEFVSNDIYSLHTILEQTQVDVNSSYAIRVSADNDLEHSILVSADFESNYCVANPFKDFEISYSLRPFISNDCFAIHTLDVHRAYNDVLSSFNLNVSNDIQSVSSLRELIKNDVLSVSFALEEVNQSFESLHDITTVNFVHRDFLGIHNLIDPTPVIINYGFWVKLEGEE